VLIEPLDESNANNPVSLLKQVANSGRPAALVTLFCLSGKKNLQPGTCLLLKEEGTVAGDSLYIKDNLLQEARNVMQQRVSSFHNYMTAAFQFTAFTEYIPPAISLVIVGAGNDVFPLVTMAGILGWKTTVIDGRPAYAKKERFPASCSVILAKPEQVIAQLPINNRTAIVLMTHNYNYDLAMIKALTRRKIKYTGMLGPKKKLERMIAELAAEDIHLAADQLAAIHSPVGLDIGAETPEEIALSVMAEIQSVFAAAKALPLKENTAPIHDRKALNIGQMDLSAD
jgi:xanthine/CO dehydrogenase XdhC/CoxF family maturation factor